MQLELEGTAAYGASSRCRLVSRAVKVLLGIALASSLHAIAQSGVLERIRTTGTMKIGYIEDGAPFSSVGPDRQPQGYSIELCREVALAVRTQLSIPRVDIQWVPLTIQNRLEAVRTGRVDIECSTTTWTLSRQATVDFSLITFVDGGSILSRSGANLRRLVDVDGKRIGVIAGTTTEKMLSQALTQRGLKSELVRVKTRVEGLSLLEAGGVDGFASDRTTLLGLLAGRSAAGTFTLLEEDFSVEPYVLSVPRDYEFRLAVNRALARIYRTGQITSIYNRWLGGLGPPSLLLSTTYFVQSLNE
jgi:polar amino acid transport system substrate-binding protein/glutamate/aspartate transport system substrate-binding protein